MLYFNKRDLHSDKTLYIIEICGRLYPQQREYLKTNNSATYESKLESLDNQKLKYRSFLIEKVELTSNFVD